MSQEDLETVRRAREAWELGDSAAFDPLCSPELIYRPVAEFTESEECRGLVEFRRFGESFREAWADDFIGNASFRDHGDTVIARIDFSGHARASGIEITGRVYEVFWLRGGLIVRIEDFATSAAARKAVGLD